MQVNVSSPNMPEGCEQGCSRAGACSIFDFQPSLVRLSELFVAMPLFD